MPSIFNKVQKRSKKGQKRPKKDPKRFIKIQKRSKKGPKEVKKRSKTVQKRLKLVWNCLDICLTRYFELNSSRMIQEIMLKKFSKMVLNGPEAVWMWQRRKRWQKNVKITQTQYWHIVLLSTIEFHSTCFNAQTSIKNTFWTPISKSPSPFSGAVQRKIRKHRSDVRFHSQL